MERYSPFTKTIIAGVAVGLGAAGYSAGASAAEYIEIPKWLGGADGLIGGSGLALLVLKEIMPKHFIPTREIFGCDVNN